jgi:hypothetical protein
MDRRIHIGKMEAVTFELVVEFAIGFLEYVFCLNAQ